MIVNRTVFLNPVEPHPLSFRAPRGMETKLNIAFIGQDGVPYSSDIAAQLQLTGRTSARTDTYLVPATDIVNGRARAVIPADGLNDSNGYRLRLLGSLNGEPALLAVGSVAPVFAAGLDAVEVDVIDTIPLTFEYGEDVNIDVTVWQDSGKGSVYDLTDAGTSISANVYANRGGVVLMPFTVTVLDINKVRLSLTEAQVNTLPATCWWTLVAANSTGATTLCEGDITVTGDIPPVLVETLALYDYQTPSSGDINPVGGQIIHNAITQNILKVAKTTSAAVDLSAVLAMVTLGDEIALNATVWTVERADEGAGWWAYHVTPIAMDATTGVTTVTFRRP